MNKKTYASILLIGGLLLILSLVTQANESKNDSKNTSDSLITTKIVAKFAADPELISKDIITNTYKDQVQLCGFVKNTQQGQDAVKIAQTIKGVKKVIDSLTPLDSLKISDPDSAEQYLDDVTLTANVKKALLANEEIPVIAVHVVTHDGYVQLCGFVDDKSISQQAESTTKKIDGVRKVKNSLLIKE